jgi:hypothetical protein
MDIWQKVLVVVLCGAVGGLWTDVRELRKRLAKIEKQISN